MDEKASPSCQWPVSQESTRVILPQLAQEPEAIDEMHDSQHLEDPEDSSDEIKYPKPWRLALITFGLCLAILCTALDNTIITTAIPEITKHYNSLQDVGWYGSAYLLASCALTLPFGKLYTFYSTKWVFMAALGVFEVGSLVCALAPTSTALIVGRAIAGLGAAGLYSGAMIIISQTVALDKRPILNGLLGAMYGIASVTGPLMGGAFTDYLSWRWCFYINLPIGGITALFIMMFFQAPKSIKNTHGFRNQLSQLDLVSMLLFIPSITCLLLAMQWGGSKYPWGDGRIIALFVVFCVLLLAFVFMQWWRGDLATISPRLIKNRNVWGASVFIFCLSGSFLVIVYYIPIWFQAVKGVSATKSGIMSIPILLCIVITSLLAGVIVTTLGYYTPFMLVAPVITAIGAGLLTTLHVESGHTAWIGYQAMAGIGVGMGLQQSMIVFQAVLPMADIPSATTIGLFAQSLGGALFISVGQEVFQTKLRSNLRSELPGVDTGFVMRAGATKLNKVVDAADLPVVLDAYSKAITQTFYVSVTIGALAIIGALPVQWISVKKTKLQ